MNINPALYARKLCTNIEHFTKRDPRGYLKKPKELIRQAWETNEEQGTSTLVVVTLPFEGDTMYSAWVGDSGYCILRIYEHQTYSTVVVYASKAQQKGFNYPYQLGQHSKDKPEIAKTDTHQLQQGDIVVVGSDGVFDNLTPEQVADVVQLQLKKSRGKFDSQIIAKAIADEAFRYSLDDKYNSPFAKEAAKYQEKYQGGKSDDISVSLGQVNLAQHKHKPASDGSSSKSNSQDKGVDISTSTQSSDHSSL